MICAKCWLINYHSGLALYILTKFRRDASRGIESVKGAENSRSSFWRTVITTKQAALKQKYSQTLTEDNLNLRLRDQGSQQDENKAKRYNEHL